jgi:trimethylamine:corrinoid methyltransferase-like protein
MVLHIAAQLAGLVLSQLKAKVRPLFSAGAATGSWICAPWYPFTPHRMPDPVVGTWPVTIGFQPSQPPEISKETLASDLIHETGPDGHFLESEQTLRHFRELWTPALFDRMDFETWSAKGSLTLQQKANQRVLEVIASHRTEPLPSKVKAKLADAVARK